MKTKRPNRPFPFPGLVIRWDLISCGFNGHFLVGTDARELTKKDGVFARESDGLRQYRCLRCGSWVIKPVPVKPTRDTPPARDEIKLPIRGKLLRDHYVLRLIAVDRAVHVLILSAIAIAIFLFGTHQEGLKQEYFQLLRAFQGVNGSLTFSNVLLNVQGIFSITTAHIYEIGAIVAIFAGIETIEMIGLWQAKRWAEYLTFIATILFIPYEVYELIHGFTVIKVAAFLVNLAIAGYLLYSKHLFGTHGGVKSEQNDRSTDTGWAYLERTAPKPRS